MSKDARRADGDRRAIAVSAPHTDGDIAETKALFREYAATLGADPCLAHFDEEMARFPAGYRRLLLAKAGGAPVGAVGLSEIDAAACEMRRLYVRPSARGLGAGAALTDACVREARAFGYRRVVLETLPTLAAALALYERFGFVAIAPYAGEAVDGVICMELSLAGSANTERVA